MRIIRYGELASQPWKNGGGVTREALREPAEGEPYGWRLSFAEVGSSGPFSDFSGYERHLVLLHGEGVRLEFGDGTSQTLRRLGDLAHFDGGIATRGVLLAGPCTDLNLIVARSRYRVDARVLDLEGPLPDAPAPGKLRLVVPLDGAVRVTAGSGPACRLSPRDLAVGAGLSIEPECSCRVFVAGIVDNPP